MKKKEKVRTSLGEKFHPLFMGIETYITRVCVKKC